MQPQSQAPAIPHSHKLLITYKVSGELVRAEGIDLILIVKNMGDVAFTGGRFSSIRLEFSAVTSSVSESDLQEIPVLEPQAEAESTYRLFLPVDGFGWVVAQVKADDGQPVEHYQNQSFATGQEWRNSIYVERREERHIISLLEKIATLLERSQ